MSSLQLVNYNSINNINFTFHRFFCNFLYSKVGSLIIYLTICVDLFLWPYLVESFQMEFKNEWDVKVFLMMILLINCYTMAYGCYLLSFGLGLHKLICRKHTFL
jgi:hypothetical protein